MATEWAERQAMVADGVRLIEEEMAADSSALVSRANLDDLVSPAQQAEIEKAMAVVNAAVYSAEHCAFCGVGKNGTELLLKGKEAYICGSCATNCERLTREAMVRKRLKGERLQQLEAENAELKANLDRLMSTLKGLLPPT